MAAPTTTNFTGIGIKATASNPNVGTATLVAGSATVAKTDITAADFVLVSVTTAGGTQGNYSVAITAGTGFVITSDSALDTSTITYMVVKVV